MWLKLALGTAVVLLWVGLALGCWLKCSTGLAARPRPAAAGGRLVCSLSPSELDGRRQRLASFTARAHETKPLENGLALRFAFDEGLLEEASRLIVEETRCCSFLEFCLTVQPTQDLLAIEITGPAGTREFLDASPAFKAAAARATEVPDGTAKPGCGCAQACSPSDCSPGRSTE